MPKRRKSPQAPAWVKLGRAVKIPPGPERIRSIRAAALARGHDPAEAERMVLEPTELWQNDRYTVSVSRQVDGTVEHLSIRRNDRAPEPFPWRDLQRIKTQLAGEEAEAIELFPAESRLLDTANQRWLWCFPPGFVLPRGFRSARTVAGPEEAAAVGAQQAPLEEVS